MRKLTTAGETIVEVLIVLVILGSALTTAFVITGKATANTRTSLERSSAVAFGQTQLERIKAKLNTPPTATETTNMDSTGAIAFCIDNANTVQPVSNVVTGGCFAGTNNLYRSYTIFDGTKTVYTTTVIWDDAGGNGQNNVTLVYRAYVSYLGPLPDGVVYV